MWSASPNLVVDGDRYAIGWQQFPDKKGGRAYVIARRGILGGRRVVERYPLTADGWARAWTSLARLDPATAAKTRAALERRVADRAAEAARAESETGWLAFIPGLVLGGAD